MPIYVKDAIVSSEKKSNTFFGCVFKRERNGEPQRISTPKSPKLEKRVLVRGGCEKISQMIYFEAFFFLAANEKEATNIDRHNYHSF